MYYKGNKVNIQIDDCKLDGDILLCAVANGKYYGGGIKIAPEALVDDGFFDVYYIEKLPRLKVLFLLPRLLNGSHVSLPCVKAFKAKKVKITGKDFLLNIDGDLQRISEVTMEIVPGAINFMYFN